MAIDTAILMPTQMLDAARRHRHLLLPLAALSMIFVVLVPLPTPVLDFLLITNIAVSALLLTTVMYISTPLELSVFPTLLLGTALFRLVLNTASTRLILTNAEHGTLAAGRVIATFGEFVASGSLVVGVLIFVIVVVIQFVVITKGATRIAEVAARFTLDGMPGKQMAVDADLNAGLISEAQARQRRQEITREADFYGAMDGASKFVRGDAIAGIIITFINMLGGLYVGMVEMDPPYSFKDTLRIFTTLTIGDGLVAQIPAFIVSLAAAMVVSRSASTRDLGEETLAQVVSRPVALSLTAGFLGALLLTPFPKPPLLLMMAGCAGLAHILRSSNRRQDQARQAEALRSAREPDKVEKLLSIDAMELDVGYALIKLVDRRQGGDLLDRIAQVRRQQAGELGIIVPPIRIRDNIQLEPNRYVIKLRGIEVARGEAVPGQHLAIDSGAVSQPLPGSPAREPAFNLPALWVTAEQKQLAEHRNYTVVDASSVLITHLTETIKRHADELLTREAVNRLIDHLKEHSPKVVEELIPQVLKKVLQALLRERVPIRDLEVILETLSDWAGRTKDTEVLTEYARNALARTISQQQRTANNKIVCLTLDPRVEEVITRHIQRSDHGSTLNMPPALQNRVVEAVRLEVQRTVRESGGHMPVILVAPQTRLWVRRLIEGVLPQVAVLAFNEIVRGTDIESRGMVVLNHESQNV
jgi:flagellar biosynthesis protein FlhA